MHGANYPILFHLLIEVPAAITFTFHPKKQLQNVNTSHEAILICRSYGGLLWAVNVLCLQHLIRRGEVRDDVTAMLSSSLAVYHVFPIIRASMRIWSRDEQQHNTVLGGPLVHLLVHVGLFISLIWSWTG